jgi:hypothetical protein
VFKRVIWFGIGATAGAAAGAGGTVWAQQQVRRRLDALSPDHVVHTANDAVRRAGRTVAEAIGEGRTAMRQREAELRAQRRTDGAAARPVGGPAVHRTAPPPRRTRPSTWPPPTVR